MPASPSANSPLPPLPLRGGCLCGQVRYAIAPLPSQTSIIDAGYCHCRLCQRASGAPVVAWATVRRAALHMLAGTGTTYASSAKGRRTFCPRCGTALFFTHADQPDTVDITLASLDDPAALTPEQQDHLSHAVKQAVNEVACQLAGTFSAEHGIGQVLTDEMALFKPAVEIDLMHAIKRAIDPEQRFNPGRLLPSS